MEAQSHVEMLRNELKQLDLELQRHRVIAKGEISAAKNAVKLVEQETLQGKRSLANGKTDIEQAWRHLDTIQAKHKVHLFYSSGYYCLFVSLYRSFVGLSFVNMRNLITT